MTAVLKSNPYLSTLIIDYCPLVPSSSFRFLFSNIRVFGQGLQKLSLNDTPLSVDTVYHLFSVLEGQCPLSDISLVRCGIGKTHLARAMECLNKTKHLKYLNLSDNLIEDEGAIHIADAIRLASESPLLAGFSSSVLRLNVSEVEREVARFRGFSIHGINVSGCGLTAEAVLQLVDALTLNHTVKDIDVSDNPIGPNHMHFLSLSLLKCIDLVEFKANRCGLQSKGVTHLLTTLASYATNQDNERIDNKGLRVLQLSGNGVKDSAADALEKFLSENNVLQFLDLGFNEFTDQGLRHVRQAIVVKDKSPALRKYNELHINLNGNNCDPYALDFPNQSRAKATMRYGTELSRSVANVPSSSKPQYLEQTAIQNQLGVSGLFVNKGYVV